MIVYESRHAHRATLAPQVWPSAAPLRAATNGVVAEYVEVYDVMKPNHDRVARRWHIAVIAGTPANASVAIVEVTSGS